MNLYRSPGGTLLIAAEGLGRESRWRWAGTHTQGDRPRLRMFGMIAPSVCSVYDDLAITHVTYRGDYRN